MLPDSSEEIVRVRLEIPQLQTEVELGLSLDETIWNLKNNVIKTIASELKESLNFGFYIPSSTTKAAKYLDEDRNLREYNLSHDTLLQLISKKRIYKAAVLNTKKLKEINRKISRKKLIGYIDQGNEKRVKELLDKGLDPNFIDSDLGECPLTLSVCSKLSTQMIKHMVGAGAHLDYRNKEGWTAMHKAARNGRLGAIKTLLDFGASPNYRDLNGLTPLYISVCHDTAPECIKQLLKDYAILGITDDEGNSEIHQVCLNGRVQHLDLLITYGADINSINICGNTPLHICAMKNQEECARLLLFRGADKHIRNSLNQEPHDLARFYKNDRLKEVIECHTSEDVVISNELPNYNDKSRLTLKRSNRNSLLLSKMNKLSLSTPYLHQSVTNINWEYATKFSNDCSSVKSSNSENHSTGSADQQFEFDADVTPVHESRPNSFPNNTSQIMIKSLREKQSAIKVQPNKSPSVDFSKKSHFSKKLTSSDVLNQLDSGFHETPLRRQSYGDVLDASPEDIYMNDWEIERRFSTEQKNIKFPDDSRMIVNFSNPKDLDKPKNTFSRPTSTFSNVISNCSTLTEDVYLNSTEASKLNDSYKPNFQTMHPTPSKKLFINSFQPTRDHMTTLPSAKAPQHFSSSSKNDSPHSPASKFSETQKLSPFDHKVKDFSTCNKTLDVNKSQVSSHCPGPTFAFIPPPPVFPSTFKSSNSSTTPNVKKMNSSSCKPPMSPPLPPPPPDFSSFSPTYPLPPPPVTQQHPKVSNDDHAKAELLAAIMKRRNELDNY